MRVVITGGGGFLGRQLCRKLLFRGVLTAESGLEEAVEEIVLFDSHFQQAIYFATILTTSSSATTWLNPTRCGICLALAPQTIAYLNVSFSVLCT